MANRTFNLRRLVVPALLFSVMLAGIALAAGSYHGNTQSRIFHDAYCRYFDCKHCTAVFETREGAIAAGFRPCKVCKP